MKVNIEKEKRKLLKLLISMNPKYRNTGYTSHKANQIHSFITLFSQFAIVSRFLISSSAWALKHKSKVIAKINRFFLENITTLKKVIRISIFGISVFSINFNKRYKGC